MSPIQRPVAASAADGLAPPPATPTAPVRPSGPPSREGAGAPARGGYVGRGGGGRGGEAGGGRFGGPPRPAGGRGEPGGRFGPPGGGGGRGYAGRGDSTGRGGGYAGRGDGTGRGGGYAGRGGQPSFGGRGGGGGGGYAPRGPDGGGPSTSAPFPPGGPAPGAGAGAGRGWGDRPPRPFGAPSFSPPTSFSPSGGTSSGDFRPAYGGGGGRGGGRGGRGGRRDNQAPLDDGLVKNGAIQASEVRLLGTDKAMLGVMRLDDALALASEAGVDVVLISPDADPPVARLVSASKFRFEQAKAVKDASRKQREARQELKELKMRLNTDVHDYQVRLRAAQKFIAKGDRVKLTVALRGREMEYANTCRELFDRFVVDLGGGDVVAVVAPPSMAGRQMSVILGPNKDKVAAAAAAGGGGGGGGGGAAPPRAE